MEIKPAYITPEQYKSLIDLGFHITIDSSASFSKSTDAHDFAKEVNGKYKEGIPDFEGKTYDVFYKEKTIPKKIEQWQVVEWLRVKYDIWVEVSREYGKGEYIYQYFVNRNIQQFGYGSPQEAYSAAFDYIFNTLIKEEETK